jgi:hypothetical protein
MKREGRCIKCGSVRVGRMEGLPDTLGVETELSRQAVGVLRDEDGKPRLVGQIEAYVCTECGYLEAYVQDPQGVPFERLEGFSWVGEGAHPYR